MGRGGLRGLAGPAGPRYARLAAALLEAIDQQTLARAPGARRADPRRGHRHLPGHRRRLLRPARRGRRADQAPGRGHLRRRAPSWAARPAAGTVATMLLRRVAEDRETIDLSVSAPGDLRHLPPADPEAAWQSLDGHGLDPAGLPGCAPRSPATSPSTRGCPPGRISWW